MSNDDVFLLFQLKDGAATRNYRFESFDNIQQAGLSVNKDNYKHVYTAPLTETDTPDSIYVRLNFVKPADLAGHSPSVSDIFVLCRGGEATALYVDPVGFVQVPEFLAGPYKYYATQRPVDIGTFPKTENSPAKIVNFDSREWVENATFRAWGYVAYDALLTQQQASDFELRPASDNPDQARPSPYQLEAQAQVVGKWEQAKRVPEMKRVTEYHNDFGVYVKKDFISHERLTERFGQAVENNTRAAARRAYKKYPDLIKNGAEQVQVVGAWEDMKGMPDNERYTCHKPSIQGFALREPVVKPEKLMERYQLAKQELTLADKQAPPKTIAQQLAEGAAQAAKDNAARPAPAKGGNAQEER